MSPFYDRLENNMNNTLHPHIEKILVSKEEIENIIEKISDKINSDYKGEELVVVVILKGSLVFASDLIRKINVPVTLEFMRVSSYGSGTSTSGFINIKQDLEDDISGKNVLIIEDIIDSGNTLYRLKKVLSERNAKTCRICTLLDKPERRTTDVEVEYMGKAIPNEFVVGYGLDYNENYRNLPYVGVLKREIYE